jgi:transcriptional regulator with XRE-family HTH domain
MAAMGIASLIELADTADAGRDTLYRWFKGATPSAKPLGRVAGVLGVSYRELMNVFEGHEEAPPGGDQTGLLVAAIADLTAAIRSQGEPTARLLQALIEVQAEQTTHVEENSTRIATLGEALARLAAREGQGTTGRPLPRETKG